jgi:hypothetical protein
MSRLKHPPLMSRLKHPPLMSRLKHPPLMPPSDAVFDDRRCQDTPVKGLTAHAARENTRNSWKRPLEDAPADEAARKASRIGGVEAPRPAHPVLSCRLAMDEALARAAMARSAAEVAEAKAVIAAAEARAAEAEVRAAEAEARAARAEARVLAAERVTAGAQATVTSATALAG